MKPIPRLLVILCCALGLAQAVWLCGATGWRVFTRFPDPALAGQSANDNAVGDLFFNPELDGGTPPFAPIENDFALGWLPAGPGKFMLSVSTIGGPVLLAAGIALLSRRPSQGKTP